MRVSPGWVETEAAVQFVEAIAKQAGTDCEGGKKIIMEPLGGIPSVGPPVPRKWPP